LANWTTLLNSDDYLGAKKHIKSGADVNETNEQGESLLMQALHQRCSDELLDLLVQNGADLFAVDHEGVSVFEAAITYNNIGMVKRIIEKGIDTNATKRTSGFTPLMAAICYNRIGIVELLLQHGADPAATDRLGLDCAAYARKTHRKKMLELLENANGTD
jgi:ankyrin repeat protein